jgi:hypothetical protein
MIMASERYVRVGAPRKMHSRGKARVRGWPAQCLGVPLRSETKGPGRSLPRPDADHPLQDVGSRGAEDRRAISVQLDRVTSGQSRVLSVGLRSRLVNGVKGDDLPDSQADSPVSESDPQRVGHAWDAAQP